jgi:hypothetical protein
MSCPLHARPRGALERDADCLEQVAHSQIAAAIVALAHAAALFSRTRRFTELSLGVEDTYWFLVRSLCHELGLPFEQFEAAGRRAAALTETVVRRPEL